MNSGFSSFPGSCSTSPRGRTQAYIVGRSIQFGWRGGAAAATGISVGCLVHVFGAAIGLSALLMASSAAFTVLKWAGAAYLLVTGVQMLLSHSRPLAEAAVARQRDRRLPACSGRVP
jgi:threonine/homoserine/homoserine lactone efflux protein